MGRLERRARLERLRQALEVAEPTRIATPPWLQAIEDAHAAATAKHGGDVRWNGTEYVPGEDAVRVQAALRCTICDAVMRGGVCSDCGTEDRA